MLQLASLKVAQPNLGSLLAMNLPLISDTPSGTNGRRPSKSQGSIKYYIYEPESDLEKEMHKFLWDFEIKTDYQTLVRSDIVLKNMKKRTC